MRRTSSGPIPSRATRSPPIRGHLCFFDERVDTEIDGELQERPLTPWSPGWRDPNPEEASAG